MMAGFPVEAGTAASVDCGTAAAAAAAALEKIHDVNLQEFASKRLIAST